jgi:hypothetical protein
LLSRSIAVPSKLAIWLKLVDFPLTSSAGFLEKAWSSVMKISGNPEAPFTAGERGFTAILMYLAFTGEKSISKRFSKVPNGAGNTVVRKLQFTLSELV